MKRITGFDFLCALALLFSACTSAVKTDEVESESEVIGATIAATQTSTPSPIGPVPTRTLDLYRPDTVRETYTAEQATKGAAIATQWASGPTSTPRPKSTSMPSSTPIPTTDPDAAFSGRGPWLVYEKSLGENPFFAVNLDGSGRTLINIPGAISRGPIFSLSGFQMAYIVGESTDGDLRLIVARYPDGKIEGEIALFSPDWQTTFKDQPYSDQAIQTIQAAGQMLWSPGGRYLAFVGALHGPHSDLYVFDLSTKEIRRLSDGPYQARIMSWSPDGKWIVHQSVKHFGTGAGISGDAVWAAAVDGSEVRHLYNAPLEQTLATWMDTQRFVIYEWGQPYGPINILRASIGDGSPLVVYEGPLGIERRENFVFNVDQGIAVIIGTDYEIKAGETFGLYFSSIQYKSEPQLVLPGRWRGVSYWEERGLFLAIGGVGEIVGFKGDGEVVFRTEVVGAEGATVPAPKNYRFAIYNDQGAWLYDWEGKLIRQVMNRSVEEFLWGPDGRTFYMLVEEDHTLYVGDAYSGDLAIVDTDVNDLMLIGRDS